MNRYNNYYKILFSPLALFCMISMTKINGMNNDELSGLKVIIEKIKNKTDGDMAVCDTWSSFKESGTSYGSCTINARSETLLNKNISFLYDENVCTARINIGADGIENPLLLSLRYNLLKDRLKIALLENSKKCVQKIAVAFSDEKIPCTRFTLANEQAAITLVLKDESDS
jgi:hypothetical protein